MTGRTWACKLWSSTPCQRHVPCGWNVTELNIDTCLQQGSTSRDVFRAPVHLDQLCFPQIRSHAMPHKLLMVSVESSSRHSAGWWAAMPDGNTVWQGNGAWHSWLSQAWICGLHIKNVVCICIADIICRWPAAVWSDTEALQTACTVFAAHYILNSMHMTNININDVKLAASDDINFNDLMVLTWLIFMTYYQLILLLVDFWICWLYWPAAKKTTVW